MSIPFDTALTKKKLSYALNLHLISLKWHERMAVLKYLSHLKQVFSTSYSLDDQIITHHIATYHLPIIIFTIDSGRLFEAVQSLHAKTDKYYNIKVKTYMPDSHSVEDYIEDVGLNGFYDSVSLREKCCFIRKVQPLTRALSGADIWISGLRKDHSQHRASLELCEWDDTYQLIKIYPLLDATEAEVRDYIKQHDIPYNPMYDNGFPSIGCSPCTRAVGAEENPRAGRWWWEQDTQKECGLHHVNGKLVRINRDKNA